MGIAALMPLSATAQDAVGRARGVYFEAAPGVLVDATMLRRPSAPRWVDVEIEGPQAPGRTRQLALVPPRTEVAPGDLVSLRLGEPKSSELAQVLPAASTDRAIAVTPQGPKFAESASTGASSVPPQR